MLLRHQVLEGIRTGAVSLAFRRWRRPTVRAGGTLLTGAGQLSIGAVSIIAAAEITESDAHRAGYPSRRALLTDLDSRPDGDIYRIELGGLTPDPRVALRDALPSDAELAELAARLARMDERSPGGPWTRRVLDLIAAKPGVLAATLARQLGEETRPFKANVRKLKALGLTESLEIGYRLSPRGTALRHWSGAGPEPPAADRSTSQGPTETRAPRIPR